MTTTTATANDNSLGGARAWFAAKGLVRRREDRVISGVSGAFARRYGMNPLVTRLISIGVAVIFTPLVYIALWVLMPFEG